MAESTHEINILLSDSVNISVLSQHIGVYQVEGLKLM